MTSLIAVLIKICVLSIKRLWVRCHKGMKRMEQPVSRYGDWLQSTLCQDLFLRLLRYDTFVKIRQRMRNLLVVDPNLV
jgi:hypothetical protein